jgi:hypothetical protein
MSYKPTEVDLEWARNMLDLVKDGGLLIYPATMVQYRLDHKNKKMTLENPEQLDEFPSFVIHQQTIEVFKVLGYAVGERV